MLPSTSQFIIAMIASALTHRLTRKLDYMREEQRILIELLQQAARRKCIAFTADHRRRLAIRGKDLTAKERKACCHIVRPKRSWHGTGSSALASMMAHASARWVGRGSLMRFGISCFAWPVKNLGWGYTKLRDALRGLNIEIGRTTIANIR